MEEEKLKLGIDIDDVVCELNSQLVKHFNKEFDKDVLLEDIYDDHAFDKIFGLKREEIIESIYKFIFAENMENLPLIKDSREVILNLQENFEINFITSRHPNNKDSTLIFLNKHFPDNNFRIFFSSDIWKNSGKTKSEYCLDENINYLIEDNKKYALSCANSGIKVFLMDKPWNQDCEHKNIIRIESWNDVLEKLNGN